MIIDNVSDNKGEGRRVAFSDVSACLSPQSPVMSELCFAILIAAPTHPVRGYKFSPVSFFPNLNHCIFSWHCNYYFYPVSEAPPDRELSEKRNAVLFTAGPEPSTVPDM